MMRVGFFIGLALTSLLMWRMSVVPSTDAPDEPASIPVKERSPRSDSEPMAAAAQSDAPASLPEADSPAPSPVGDAPAPAPAERPTAPAHYAWWPPFDGELKAQRFARYVQRETGLTLIVSPGAARQYSVLLACAACDPADARARLVRTLNTAVELRPVAP